MKPTIYTLAAQAQRAIDALRTKRWSAAPSAPREKVRVVRMTNCRVCGGTHQMGLGAPRCTAPASVVPPSRGNPAFASLFC